MPSTSKEQYTEAVRFHGALNGEIRNHFNLEVPQEYKHDRLSLFSIARALGKDCTPTPSGKLVHARLPWLPGVIGLAMITQTSNMNREITMVALRNAKTQNGITVVRQPQEGGDVIAAYMRDQIALEPTVIHDMTRSSIDAVARILANEAAGFIADHVNGMRLEARLRH